MSIVSTQGIVLKYTNVGEADRILTILTKNRGKIQAIVKGCRKPKSRFLPLCEVFSVSELMLYKGSKLYHISQGELLNSFYKIRNDLILLTYATYFAELVEFVSDEDIPSEKLFILIVKSLYHISNGDIDVKTMNLAFQLKILDICGLRPNILRCSNCGDSEDTYTYFSNEAGGILCNNCASSFEDSKRINQAFVNIVKLIYQTEISRLNTIKIDNTIFSQMDKLIRNFLECHLDKKFKALNFLDEIKNEI